MRHTLMVLSILRPPRMVRRAFILIYLVLAFAASGAIARAEQTHAHKKTATSQAHRRVHPAPAHAPRHAAVRATRHTTSSSRRRPTSRHDARLVRSRMPIRHYAWMSAHRSSTSAHVLRTSESDASPPDPADRMTASDVSTRETEAPSPDSATPSEPAETTDAVDNNTSTAQEAANQIAASAEVPAHHAAVASSTEVASNAVVPSPLRSSSIVAMAPLRGSLESLVRQNEKTNADNLERIEDDADLHDRIAHGLLVPVPESAALTVNASLPTDRRYCRPWTAKFLSDLAKAHQAEFHHSFEVSSAVRTVEYQKRLMRINGNAAPAEGDIASPHLTGATIDIAKSGMTRQELYWMRDRLNALQNEGKLDVEEEFHQACFHITVYKSYVGAGPAHRPHKTATPPPSQPDDNEAPADVPDTPATGA